MISKEVLIGIAKDKDLESHAIVKALGELVHSDLLRPWAEMEVKRALDQFAECGLSDVESLVKAYPEVTGNLRSLARAQVDSHLACARTNDQVRYLHRISVTLDALKNCLKIEGNRKKAFYLMIVLDQVLQAFLPHNESDKFQREMQLKWMIVDLVTLLGSNYYVESEKK